MPANNILALDIGTVRIGVARVNAVAKIPEMLPTLSNDTSFLDKLIWLIAEYQIDTLVVGLPRNMSGEETAQTTYVRNFCAEKLEDLGIPVNFQDETLSSVAAEEYLQSQGIGGNKGDVDAAAAAIIVQDYLGSIS